MTFSKWLLIAMVALGVLFIVLLWQDPVSEQPIERSTIYRLMMLLTGGAGLFVALALYHQARTQETAAEKAKAAAKAAERAAMESQVRLT
jgi:peptidoglycan/LPS O-acetylase OafA/YrhL